MIVTDLDQIQPHTSGLLDLELEAFYTQLKGTHPDIDEIEPRRINEDSFGKKCEACGAPVITSWSLVDDTTRPTCKNCVVALKMRGYGEFRGFRYLEIPGWICIEAQVRIDARGYPVDVLHMDQPIEPEKLGDGTMWPGLKALVADGKVEIDEATHLVTVDGQLAKQKARQPGQQWRRLFKLEGGVLVGTERITTEMVTMPQARG